MQIEFILLIPAAYIVGSIPAAYLVARWRRGIDIRRHGSGNVGAANILALVSKRWSIVVTLFDIGKGALTVWVAQLLGLGAAQQVTIGVITIVGHNWPVFLHFQGGRGVFTSLGVITMLSPKLGLIMLVIPYTLAPIRQVALGVTIALVSLPFLSWFLARPFDIFEPLLVTLGFLALFLVAMLRRLTAPRTSITASVPPGELLVNRLLFDRDIRDRETWIHRTSTEGNLTESTLEQSERQAKD